MESNAKLILNDKQLQFYALAEIDNLLRSIGKSLSHFTQLPQPPSSYLNQGSNNLIIKETSYDIKEMEAQHQQFLQNYNEHQLRSKGDIVLPVASSSIEATLKPGGRTAHSRFKIPIVLDEFSLCNIGHDSDIAELIKQTKLIIWDEAPMQHRYMQHRYAFECLDRSLKDIMKSVYPARSQMPFGGIAVVLGGDFRQILHAIAHGETGEIVSACITRFRLWSI
ncbi:uncharacterized protein LOC141720138 [Apium graveolens]|uniref:uncharacterized protein LOC141720138 n=1 Tax=Apium graveolens TaxID=4045 RepID=UPI003D7A9347